MVGQEERILTVETVTRRRKVVSTKEHLLMGWHWYIDLPAQWKWGNFRSRYISECGHQYMEVKTKFV